MANEDEEGVETTLWRRALETLLARGASPAEAVEGANLILHGYRRQRQAEAVCEPPSSEPPDDLRDTGMRRRLR